MKIIIKKAFSLIELSIVILIIGILIAGVTQGSRVLNQARLNNARTLTQSSPVSSIKGLVLWLETTTEKSFDESKAEDSIPQENWYDINPQSVNNFTLTQTSGVNKPTYSKVAINNLPALQFDGSDYFEIPYNRDLNPNKLTIFSVIKVSSLTGYHSVISSRDTDLGYTIYINGDGANDLEIWYGEGGGDYVFNTANQEVGGISIDRNTLIVTKYDGSNATLYKNGAQIDTDAVSFVVNDSRPLRIGSGATETTPPDFYFNGYIGEIIIFSRSLKNEEREAVENYLIKKWGIN